MKIRKIFYAVTILAMAIPACMPAPTAVVPTATATVATSTPTLTLTPTPTFIPKPTNTPTLIPTKTPTPTETPIPTIDVMALFTKAGVDFPKDTSSHFEANYGQFNFRISKGLSDKIGKPYIQLPQQLLEDMYLHAMGKYMFWARRTDYVRYSGFLNLYDTIRDDGGKRSYSDWPEFRDLAKAVLVKGPAPLNFVPIHETVGTVVNVKNMNISIIEKDKFDSIIKDLIFLGVKYNANKLPITKTDGLDAGSLMFINGQDIEVVIYDKDWVWVPNIGPTADVRRWKGSSLEKLSKGFDNEWYFAGIVTTYLHMFWTTQDYFLNSEDNSLFLWVPKPNEWAAIFDYSFYPESALPAFHVSEGQDKIIEDKYIKPIFTPPNK